MALDTIMGADIFLKTNINEVIKNEENDIVGVSGIGIKNINKSNILIIFKYLTKNIYNR